MSLKIVVDKNATASVERLSGLDRARLERHLLALAEHPEAARRFHVGDMRDHTYASEVGDWRVVHQQGKDQLTILAVLSRREVAMLKG